MTVERWKSCLVLSGILLAVIVFSVFPGNASSAEPDRKNVLLVTSAHPEMPSFPQYFAGIREACDQFHLGMVDIFQESLDTLRIGDSEYIRALPGYLKAKYASKKLDAIIVKSPGEAPFADPSADSFFSGVPVISVGMAYPLDVDGNIDLILHLQPGLRKLFVICGSHSQDKVLAEFVRKSEKNFPELEFTYTENLSFEEVMGAVSALPPDTAILFCSFFKDGKGLNFVPPKVAAKVSQSANRPMYGVITTLMGKGIVGGSMVDPHERGLMAGRELVRVLFGESATNEPLVKLKYIKHVNEREMVHWGLSESKLPPGFEVVNRVPTLWRDYRHETVAVSLFIFLESSLILSLLNQRKRKKIAESELTDTLVQKNEILESLTESETTLQATLASIPVGVLILEADSGRIVQANRAAEELLGRQLKELKDRPCPGCCNPCVTSELNPGFNQAGSGSYESVLHGKEGKTTPVFKTVAEMVIHGKVYNLECFLDITEKKNAEREAKKREAQLFHADKMISLGTMAAGMCHEINNPNNFILMNASMLEWAWKGTLEKLDEHTQEHGDFTLGNLPYSHIRNRIPTALRCISEGSQRIRTIVNDMKEFISSRPSGIKYKVDINDVVRSSLNLLSGKLRKSTDNLKIEYGERIPPVEGNAHLLGQVIINLLLNGAEALPDPQKAMKIATSFGRDEKKVIVEVRDEGLGIEPENLKRIFDPFFTTKRETGGTGLGLAISLNIIEAHGGHILITSTPGEGTAAVIELPAPPQSIERI
jgi:PAS domain S-box-containing protein